MHPLAWIEMPKVIKKYYSYSTAGVIQSSISSAAWASDYASCYDPVALRNFVDGTNSEQLLVRVTPHLKWDS